MKNRKTGETAMNKDSSRSHSLFTIYIETAENANVNLIMTQLFLGWQWKVKDKGRKTKFS